MLHRRTQRGAIDTELRWPGRDIGLTERESELLALLLVWSEEILTGAIRVIERIDIPSAIKASILARSVMFNLFILTIMLEIQCNVNNYFVAY